MVALVSLTSRVNRPEIEPQDTRAQSADGDVLPAVLASLEMERRLKVENAKGRTKRSLTRELPE